MRVKVTNEDATRTLRVTPKDVPSWASTFESKRGQRDVSSVELAPGKSEAFHVHAGRILICEEI